MKTGFYKMHRGWQENAVFRNEPFSRRDAWVWLIENAAFKPHTIGIKSGMVKLDRGELSCSNRFLASAWKWDEKKVRRFLKAVQDVSMIRLKTASGQTVISICNYDVYQAVENDTASHAPQQRLSSASNKKEGKKERREYIGEPNGSPQTRQAEFPTLIADDERAEKNVRRKGTRISENWQPDDGCVKYAYARGYTDEQGNELVDGFRDFWLAKDGPSAFKRDWSAAWRTWVRNDIKFHGNPASRNSSGKNSRPMSFAEAAAEVAAEFQRKHG